MAKRLTRARFNDVLLKHGACGPAMTWVSKQKRGPRDLVLKCDNKAWLTWFWNLAWYEDVMPTNELFKLQSHSMSAILNFDGDANFYARDMMEMEYLRASVLDYWPKIEAWFLKEWEETFDESIW